MNHRGILVTCACVLALTTVLPRTAMAQHNTDLTINGFGTNITDNPYRIGDTGTNNSLHVLGGGSLTNVTSVLGYGSGANYNFAVISGSGSLWTNTATGGEDGIVVGRLGSFNSIVISNGARAYGEHVYSSRFAGDFNTMTVTGNGSLLHARGSMVVGVSGVSNSLTLSDGGRIFTTTAVEIGGGNGGGGNVALVTGTGTVWTNTAVFTVGAGIFEVNNRLVISNGARIVNINGGGVVSASIGGPAGANHNEVTVTGSGSVWTNSGFVHIGSVAFSNRLIISNGGVVYGQEGYWGRHAGGDNSVFITGPNSRFDLQGDVIIGVLGVGGNTLTVADGGRLNTGVDGSGNSYLGLVSGSDNNVATITGTGSEWTTPGFLAVGEVTSGNQLIITNGGTVRLTDLANAGDSLYIGRLAGSSNNLVRVDGGNLIVTNSTSATPGIDVRRGSLVFNSGTIDTERFVATNGANSVVQFNGGKLVTRGTTVSNGSALVVGNGTSSATLRLKGGTHSFADGLTINTSARLEGNGTVQGNTSVDGTLAPGESPGQLVFVGNLSLSSTSTYEVELNGTTPVTLYDQSLVNGGVSLGNAQLSILLGFSPVTSNQFTIIDNDAVDAVIGTFNGYGEGSTVTMDGLHKFSISYTGGDGNDVVLTFLVPEPTSVVMLALGLGVVLRFRRR